MHIYNIVRTSVNYVTIIIWVMKLTVWSNVKMKKLLIFISLHKYTQKISPSLLLNDDDKLIYLLKGHDASLRNVVLHWCKNCNELFRK